MKRPYFKISMVLVLTCLLISWVATSIDDFFLPGSQPLQSGTIVNPDQCNNCHGGYDKAIEPTFSWQGSMMAHAMRDPLYLASLTIANQDAVDSGDLCIRCHSPKGWLEGRSEPTDGSELTADDNEGVQCHFCHKMIDPLSTDPGDLAYMENLTHVPTQHGNGMYVVDDQDIRRGPYDEVNDDLQANHNVKFSQFHKESALCGTCHDVSNPAFSKQLDGTYAPNTLNMAAPDFDKYEMFPVERTYSEWLMSDYNSPQGVYSEAFGGNKENVSSCQDCHMPDVTGKGCDKNFAPVRSDLPLHDMTGGNTFIPELIKAQYGDEVDAAAIDAGISRATYMLQNAATLNLNVTVTQSGYQASVEIINETGHKLPSGYPEGRRMWINLKAYDVNDLVIYESGHYDSETAILNTFGTKVYEAKLGMTQSMADIANANNNGHYSYTAGESFHFVLNNTVIKDNRLPPRGFTNTNFESVQAAPIGYLYDDGEYFDTTIYDLPSDTYKVEVKLLYQTVSKEYIEFLRDKNFTNTNGTELYNLWAANGKSEPVIMQEAEFYTSTLSNSNIELKESFRMYPNPAKEIVNFEINESLLSTNFTMAIFDLSGRLIRNINQNELEKNKELSLHLKTFSSGEYLVRLKFNNQTITKKLIIK
jgi:hypothetical protein